MNASKNEINLVELTSDFLSFIFKNKTIIFFFVFLGLALGFFKSTSNSINNKITYEKTTILYSKIESSEIIYDILKTLDQSQVRVLSKQLNVPIDKLKKVKKINIDINNTAFNSVDKTIEKSIYIKLSVIDETVYNDVLDGILRFLESNQYLKNHYNLTYNNYKQLLKVIDKKLIAIEDNYQNHNQNQIIVNQVESSVLQVAYVTLFEKKQKIQNLLNDLSLIEIISNGKSKIIDKPFGLIINLITFSFIGFIFSLIFSWILNLYKNIIIYRRSLK